jgi:hypothetical protein
MVGQNGVKKMAPETRGGGGSQVTASNNNGGIIKVKRKSNQTNNNGLFLPREAINVQDHSLMVVLNESVPM